MKDWRLEHQQRYPLMEVQDVVKLLYQQEFGGGHLIADEEESLERMKREYAEMLKAGQQRSAQMTEAIGGGLYRVSLSAITEGLAAETLNRMFVETAKAVKGTIAHFEQTLEAWLEVLKQEVSAEEWQRAVGYVRQYEAMGCPMISHSKSYRDNYYPAYRIVSEQYVRCLSMCRQIDRALEQGFRGDGVAAPLMVAIDGCSASGKSTTADTLAELYDSNLFHMDDFFLQPQQRTPERFAEPGGNVDYERFYHTVVKPLLSGEGFSYQRYDCSQQKLTEWVAVKPRPLAIVEGVYSQHPFLGDIYDLEYWLFVTPEEQKRRILERNGAGMLKRFVDEWIPLEQAYFHFKGRDPLSGKPDSSLPVDR